MRECSNLAVCSAGMCIFRRDLAFRGKKNQDKKSRLKRFYSFIIVVSYHLNCNKDEKVLSIVYCQKANEKTASATPATKAKGKEAETAATAILIVVVGFYHCDDCSKRLVPSRDTKRACATSLAAPQSSSSLLSAASSVAAYSNEYFKLPDGNYLVRLRTADRQIIESYMVEGHKI